MFNNLILKLSSIFKKDNKNSINESIENQQERQQPEEENDSKTITERGKIVDKLNEIQNEILEIGWKGIIEKYHPDFNLDNPDSVDTLKLYRHVYKNVKSRITIMK